MTMRMRMKTKTKSVPGSSIKHPASRIGWVGGGSSSNSAQLNQRGTLANRPVRGFLAPLLLMRA